MFNPKIVCGTMAVCAVLATTDAAMADEPATAPTEVPLSQQAFDAANTPSLPPFNKDPIVAAPVPAPEPVLEPYTPSSNTFKLGMTLDMGAPSGIALGLQTRLPYLPWFKWSFAGTYTLAPGIRGGVLIDPIQFPVVPVVNVETGHQYPITIPVKGNPNVDFNYTDLQAGLAFGSRDHTRLLVLVGMSYLNGSVNNIQGALPSISGLTMGNANFHGWVPDAKLGVEFLF
jgi:hypothetical protein